MSKTLFLRVNTKEIFFGYMNSLDKFNYYVVKPSSIIFKIFNKLNLNKFIFSSWKNHVKEYDLFILGETSYSFQISSYIKSKNKNARIIMYFLNTINSAYERILSDKNVDEFWTFDKNDSKKYNMKYNPQFYSNEIVLNNNDVKTDVFYFGRNKNRKDDINNIKGELETRGVNTCFKIIDSEKDFIPYEEYLDLLSSSKCVLDYNQNGQVGLSLRPMESIFFEKKLITNNMDIVNYDFYNPNNIFVLGINDMNKIKEFINTPYKKIDKDIVDYYDYKNWLKRFEEIE